MTGGEDFDHFMFWLSVVLAAACVVLTAVCVANGWWTLLPATVMGGAANAINARTARATGRLASQFRTPR